eukprot:11196811-Lingulodinium_polyedra.AAC.1
MVVVGCSNGFMVPGLPQTTLAVWGSHDACTRRLGPDRQNSDRAAALPAPCPALFSVSFRAPLLSPTLSSP